MIRVCSFLNSKREIIPFETVKEICDKWDDEHGDKKHGEMHAHHPSGKRTATFDIVTFLCITGGSVDDLIKNMRLSRYRDEKYARVLEHLREKIDLDSFASSLASKDPEMRAMRISYQRKVISNSLSGISKKKKRNVKKN